MTLTDPRDALAEQSTFIGYLTGLASLGLVVRALADDGDRRSADSSDADDFVHLLLGVAGLGASVERLAESHHAQHVCRGVTPASQPPIDRWLR
jgi:hypothetical protein